MKIVTDEYARDSLQSELEDWEPKRQAKGWHWSTLVVWRRQFGIIIC